VPRASTTTPVLDARDVGDILCSDDRGLPRSRSLVRSAMSASPHSALLHLQELPRAP